MSFASLAGLFFSHQIYPTKDLLGTFVSNDVANLLIGLPALLVSITLARKRQLIGQLFWPGALFYIFYNYAVYSLSMPISAWYVIYPLLAVGSLITIILLLRNVQGLQIKSHLEGKIHEKITGGLLVAMGTLFFFRATGQLFSILAHKTTLVQTDLALQIADLLVTPVWIVSGILLWRHHHFGYKITPAALFQAALLFIALLIFMLLQPLLTSVDFVAADFLVILVMSLIVIVPLVLVIHKTGQMKI
jgi:hypothetical protein